MNYATTQLQQEQNPYTHLTTHYEAKYKLGWYYMNAFPRACFSQILLKDIEQWFSYVKKRNEDGEEQEFKYLVLASDETFGLPANLKAVIFKVRARTGSI